MATKKPTQKWPQVVKGNHLTVTTYQDGTTKLEWDDEALLLEVRTAISVFLAKQKSQHYKKYGIKE